MASALLTQNQDSRNTAYLLFRNQNIILKNILIFINKVHNYPCSLPTSISNTISTDSPSLLAPTDYTSDWYKTHNCPPFNTSIFFKGPLLYSQVMTDNINISNIHIHSFKRSIKSFIFSVQSSDSPDEWHPNNFILHCINGLRKSVRIKNQPAVNYQT